ncbi:MAG: lycopene cyclase [Lewinellaceae bacterium]|nr:lycopene cyclase [Lewinellaceae bacterium]
MRHFDYIIIGGGCAGLSLAYRITNEAALKQCRVLIIEPESKTRNDRTWCFWGTDAGLFSPVVRHRWTNITIAGSEFSRTADIEPYHYFFIRGIDFYQHIQAFLAANPRIEILRAPADRWDANDTQAMVWANGETFTANYVFTSAPTGSAGQVLAPLHQYFKGWFIETESPVFTADTATLMDFNVAQPDLGLHFMYVLPFSSTRALVEFTTFSSQLLPDETFNQALEKYITDNLQVDQYRITDTEQGAIPMGLPAKSAVAGTSRIIPIGGQGGAIKPTTGYAFWRIQEQTQQITAQLAQNRWPSGEIGHPRRFAWYDQLLLDILVKEGQPARIFKRLFQHNPYPRILKFLDEGTTPWEEVKIFAQLPLWPFLRAWKRQYAPKPSSSRQALPATPKIQHL